MNVLETLLLVWAAGGVLSRDGDRLHIEAPKGAIPPQLLDALRANKASLLALLPMRAPAQADEATK
ncbi:hypothetical protein [Dyella lutea]|uniref:TubC N-terminal docking domain-containing protein n=1 Tax=Dyella lutea TaxID=2950441 RepID=A0ABT1F5G5_9GAMM|nr:hypothetical protein [Dyella lutea]MCP1372627.1 hypothetical protein [Dyella lutea]